MSEIYNYYYIGRTAPGVEEEGLASPVLLTFSKMKNGLPGEVSRILIRIWRFFSLNRAAVFSSAAATR